jgi:hypothetical protein
MAGCPIRRARKAAVRDVEGSGGGVAFPYLPRVVGADKPPGWDRWLPAATRAVSLHSRRRCASWS